MEEGDDKPSCVKITDFGLSRQLTDGSYNITPTSSGTRCVPALAAILVLVLSYFVHRPQTLSGSSHHGTWQCVCVILLLPHTAGVPAYKSQA